MYKSCIPITNNIITSETYRNLHEFEIPFQCELKYLSDFVYVCY